MSKDSQYRKNHSGNEGNTLNELVKKIEKLGVIKEYSKDEFLSQAKGN